MRCRLIIALLLWMVPASGVASDNSRIVFSSVTSGNWELWSIKPDGSDIKQITNTLEDKHSPAVSPDGKEILYVDSKRKLSIMNPDGTGKRELPLAEGIYAQPTWAPDGKTIAFVRYTVIPSDASEIWVIKRNEGGWGKPERMSLHPPMRLYPSFSPDGSKLVYSQFQRDEALGVVEELGILYINEMKFKQVTTDGANNLEPVWSPAGDYIAYTSNKSGNYDIWLFSIKDNKHRQLTVDPSYDGNPTWSPEGNEIAFVSTRSGSKEIWVMSVTGGNFRQITKTGKASMEPFWSK